MADFNKLFIELHTHITALEDKLLKRYLPSVNPLMTPKDYEHHVKAYCLLSHAAIEEYLEKVSLNVMIVSIDKWYKERKYTDTLTTLVCCYHLSIEIEEDEKRTEIKVFDYLRPVFANVKQRHSASIEKNHGASISYLRKLMIPVAIDIKDDVTLINSLNQLARERGAYAHKQTIKKTLSPEDARRFVKDCLLLCDDIRAKAISKFT